MNELIHIVKEIIIFDKFKGNCIFSRVYQPDSKNKKQKGINMKLLYKNIRDITSYGSPNIVSFNKHSCIFCTHSNLIFCVIGSENENELILEGVLRCFIVTLNKLLENKLEKRTLLENFDLMILTLDELIDNGVILGDNSDTIVKKVNENNESNIYKNIIESVKIGTNFKKVFKSLIE